MDSAASCHRAGFQRIAERKIIFMDIYRKDSMATLVKDNAYVGRGIVIGKTADAKKAAVAYFIMGRSENSRNRVFIEKGDEVIIEPFDVSKVEDPSLIVYDFIKDGKTFEEALETREFEPDAPNFTPRISGMLTFGEKDFAYKMSILKSADAEGSACNRYTFSYAATAGLGHFIHTYACDGNPLPTFQGEPERVAIPDDIDTFLNEIWENLNEQNKISIYVRYIDLETGAVENRMINKNK